MTCTVGLPLRDLVAAVYHAAAAVYKAPKSRKRALGRGLGAFLFLATFLVNNIPYLMSVTAEEERTHAFSVRGALQPLGGVVGGAVGGLALVGLSDDPVSASEAKK